TPAPASPNYALRTVADPLQPGDPNAKVTVPIATNPDGFFMPVVLRCQSSDECANYGAISAAAFPTDGGNGRVTAQRDIVGNETVVGREQYYAPWLMVQSNDFADTEFGLFSALSAFVSTGQITTGSQTAWWINFGSFQQGIMSVGGDVTVRAGRDIDQL